MSCTADPFAVFAKHPWDDGDRAAAFCALVDAGFVDDAVDAWLDALDVDDDAHADVAEAVCARGLAERVAPKALALLERDVWIDGWRFIVEFVVDAWVDDDRVWTVMERLRARDVQLWCALVPRDPRAVPLLRRVALEHRHDPWILNEAVAALAARADDLGDADTVDVRRAA